MLNQVLEATLAFMIVLLALSVSAIVRLGPTAPAPASSESNIDSDTAMPQPQPVPVMAGAQAGQMATAAAPMMWTAPASGSMLPAGPPLGRRPGLLGRGRYEARHVRGRMPKPRPSAPAGPP